MPGSQCDDLIAMNDASALAVTISPPFGCVRKSAMARSISPGSRTLTGLTSIPSEAQRIE